VRPPAVSRCAEQGLTTTRRSSPCSFAQAKPAAAVAVDTLPTKAADGSWVYKSAEAPQAQPDGAPATGKASKRARAALDAADPAAGAAASKRPQAAGGSAEEVEPSAALVFEQLQEQELSLSQKKERIAAACSALLEAPERNVSELKVRLQPSSSNQTAALTCALASMPLRSPGLAPPCVRRQCRGGSARQPVRYAGVQGPGARLPHSPAH
jgi:hypothetical protein